LDTFLDELISSKVGRSTYEHLLDVCTYVPLEQVAALFWTEV